MPKMYPGTAKRKKAARDQFLLRSKNEVIDLYEQGFSYVQVAHLSSLGIGYVQEIIQRWGKPRSGKRARKKSSRAQQERFFRLMAVKEGKV